MEGNWSAGKIPAITERKIEDVNGPYGTCNPKWQVLGGSRKVSCCSKWSV